MNWIDTSKMLPPEYMLVPVVHKKQIKLMRHEAGWWYGATKAEPPTKWLDSEPLAKAIKEEHESLNKIGLCK